MDGNPCESPMTFRTVLVALWNGPDWPELMLPCPKLRLQPTFYCSTFQVNTLVILPLHLIPCQSEKRSEAFLDG